MDAWVDGCVDGWFNRWVMDRKIVLSYLLKLVDVSQVSIQAL